MKQFIILLLAGCIIFLAACQSDIANIESLETEPAFLDATWQKTTDQSYGKETVTEFLSATEERNDEKNPTESPSTEPEIPSAAEKQNTLTTPDKQKVETTTSTSTYPTTEPTASKETESETKPPENTPTQPETEPPVTVPSQPETESIITEATQPETVPTAPEFAATEPPGCSHDWKVIHHEEKGHWQAGLVCDCGWTIYGNADELVSQWNSHSASYPTEEALFSHGGYGSADEWIVDEPAYDEWVCRHCGEPKP